MVERILLEVTRPVDAIHDVQRYAAVAGVDDPVTKPLDEPLCLLEETEPEQRVDRERSVADPRVAVVPVALTAGLFGESGRGRSDERTRRFVGHQLEGHRAALDLLTPAALVF